MTPTAGIQIHRVNPLELAGEIKQLFLDHQRPEFPEFFDRAYPSAVDGEATSWIGRDASGRLVMHQGRFLKRFKSGTQTARAGLFVNLMVSRELRSFFPAHALLRRALADSQADGLDFVYTDPNRVAGVLIERSGFTPIGTLRRFALPVGRDTLGHLARAYRFLQGLTVRDPYLSAVSHAAAGTAAPSGSEFQSGEDVIVPLRPVDLYQQRVHGYPAPTDAWCVIAGNGAERALGTCLIRGPDADGVALMVVLLHHGTTPLPAMLRAVARNAEVHRWRSLHVWTVDGSGFARALKQAGFLARADYSTIYGLSFTALGTDIITSGERWEITDLDCDRGI